jgi:hypothetical protein
MTLWEKTKIITESYADPEMASKYLGLWKVRYMNLLVFLLLNKGLSPAFPVTGMDNLLDLRLILQVVNTRLELSLMVWKYLLINNKGILELLLKAISTNHYRGKGRRHVTYIELLSYSN